MENRKESRHPSYGVINFSRVSGGLGRLFGSELASHGSAIKIEVHGARWIHQPLDSQDDFYAVGGDRIVELWLSPAQFAAAITSMSFGSGSPCTVRFRKDLGYVERPPEPEHPTKLRELGAAVEKISGEFLDEADAEAPTIEEFNDVLDGIRARGPVKDKLRAMFRSAAHSGRAARQVARDHLRRTLREATEAAIATAQGEVDAFASMVLNRIGLKAIDSGEALKLLMAGADDARAKP